MAGVADSTSCLRVSEPSRAVLPRTDRMHGNRVLAHRTRRRPDRNARTPHDASPSPQTAIMACTHNVFSVRTTRASLDNFQARTVYMNLSSSQVLGAFLRQYSPKAPKNISGSPVLPHENLQLTTQHGLRILAPAPATDILIGKPPTSRSKPDPECRYLWVIDRRGIPHIFEERLDVLRAPGCAEKKFPKHTNLTGGGEASMGGEMWFATDSALYVSGGSGRYPAADRCQLNAAVEVFESLGYDVISLGWNDATGYAKREWEGEPKHG